MSVEVETHLRLATELNPADERAHFNLGLWHEEQGNIGPAAESFKAALHLKPNDEEYLEHLEDLGESIDEDDGLELEEMDEEAPSQDVLEEEL
uniref:Tetratricopeptide repeat protein n=1 Tax=Pyrodinium bahamense TaxID=73915 RepID=A0A7R9ZZ76_9DINO